jgi:hypothetical protein
MSLSSTLTEISNAKLQSAYTTQWIAKYIWIEEHVNSQHASTVLSIRLADIVNTDRDSNSSNINYGSAR